MSLSMQNGYLEMIVGPMFAGKTSTLLGIIRRYQFIGYKCLAVTHSSDTRYSDTAALVSHNKEQLPAYATDSLTPVRDHPDYAASHVIAIEEAHFFSDLYDFVLQAVEKDKKNVIVVGLNGDYLRKPIGQLSLLYPLADSIHKIDALCAYCPQPTHAIFTKRRPAVATKTDSQILVGGADTYEAVCRKHFQDE